jgi:adenosylcobyric acid synthase
LAVIKLPHISNFTDFEPLAQLDSLHLAYLEKRQPLDGFKAVILPGTKSTCNDLEWLHRTGWTEALQRYAHSGGHILGICGGYQMIGNVVHDPEGVDGKAGSTQGLGLLPVETILKAPKTTTVTDFFWDGIRGRGYEIHMGRSRSASGPGLFTVERRNRQPCNDHDGCSDSSGHVLGTYMHGLFDTPEITSRWLKQIGLGDLSFNQLHGPAARDAAYELLAEHALQHIDIEAICSLV